MITYLRPFQIPDMWIVESLHHPLGETVELKVMEEVSHR